MKSLSAKKTVVHLASLAGIEINGNQPWDIKVNNERFFARLLNENSLGLGESYMDGWWDCDQIDEMINRILQSNIEDKVKKNIRLAFSLLLTKTVNFQNKKRAKIVGKKHYDTGNFLFQNMLDKDMSYTCGYWKDTNNLDDAQSAKCDLICQKLGFQPGMSVLDIGCGWGAFAKYAAKNYGVNVTGVTISKEQVDLGTQLCTGLPVEIRFQDYRDVKGQFDRIVSLGMFEHVGPKNYRTFMKTAYRCLKEKGLLLLHTIGSNKTGINKNPWLTKYIFPNGWIPSAKQITKSYERLFVMEDWHNFGFDYDKTLMAWHDNFEQNWHKLTSLYDERFKRMWDFYLLICAGSFRARVNQLWQIVLSKEGVPEGYQSIR